MVGDAETAIENAAKTVEAVYHVPMMAHVPMEPPNALAWVKDDGSCEIWAPTQAPQAAKGTVAQILGIAPENVTIHVTLLGGGFDSSVSFSTSMLRAMPTNIGWPWIKVSDTARDMGN